MARELCRDNYRITCYDAFSKEFRFKEQLASSGSIMDHIAEGFERDGNKEFVNFRYFAKGACRETRSQLHRTVDRSYINEEAEQLIQKQSSYPKK